MAPKTIKITVDDQGNMTIDPSTWRANRQETINWACINGTFTVLFPHTPFDGVEFHGDQNNPTPPKKIVQEAELGSYHYQVSVAVGGKVWMTAGCPEIIVKG